ncbi:MAG: hypothetical protein PF692_03505 [Kiritimatiellae bacterium]|jgi:hypothetical protein|nr:hypothetical protein [Kiritimatiellia bacterium]
MENNFMVIRNSSLIRLMTLGLNLYKVEISSAEQNISIHKRYAYIFSSKTEIPFSDIDYVDYSFESITTDIGSAYRGFETTDQSERFAVYVVTHDNHKHLIASFIGEGAACTGMSGVLFSDDSLIDLSGTQEEESRKFAKYLAQFLGVKIGQPMEDIVDMRKCPVCAHSCSYYIPKCIYCGATLPTEENL